VSIEVAWQELAHVARELAARTPPACVAHAHGAAWWQYEVDADDAGEPTMSATLVESPPVSRPLPEHVAWWAMRRNDDLATRCHAAWHALRTAQRCAGAWWW
jgi:hypothetical protein